MATKPVNAIADMMEDLTSENLKRFCFQLINRDNGRVKRNKVEGKSHLEIADAMVSAFTGDVALRVAVEILSQIGCGAEAERLVRVAPESFSM